MTIKAFNKLSKEEKAKQLFSCCGSSNWAASMMKKRSFNNEKNLIETAIETWYNQCEGTDWLESFTHHPKIGDIKSLTRKFAG